MNLKVQLMRSGDAEREMSTLSTESSTHVRSRKTTMPFDWETFTYNQDWLQTTVQLEASFEQDLQIGI